jgi:hypothetical protein
MIPIRSVREVQEYANQLKEIQTLVHDYSALLHHCQPYTMSLGNTARQLDTFDLNEPSLKDAQPRFASSVGGGGGGGRPLPSMALSVVVGKQMMYMDRLFLSLHEQL